MGGQNLKSIRYADNTVDSKCRRGSPTETSKATRKITIRPNIDLSARGTAQVANYKPEISNPDKYGYLNNWNVF